jgi:putative aldouronate transport system permease protein
MKQIQSWLLTYIVLPLSKPILAVIAVYTIVNSWNSWFTANIYLPSTDWQPLQMFLRRVLVSETVKVTELASKEMAEALTRKTMAVGQVKFAMIIFVTLPILCVYPYFQKYFIKGVMLGSLKE